MLRTVYLLFFGILLLAVPVSGQEGMNVLFICVDDLRPELASFGADYVHSPNIDRLAAEGRAFTRHYVNAPSCGPSRYTLLTGTYGPSGNNAIFARAARRDTAPERVTPSMPEWFRQNGYTTVAVGKVSHHPGGLGGADWNDPTIVELPDAWDRNLVPVAEWEHPRGIMHGLAHGEIRGPVRGSMAVMQSVPGPDTIYPDGLITAIALEQLDVLAADDKPFFLAVGLIKPHLPFGAPRRYLEMYAGAEIPDSPNPDKPTGVSTWHASEEFRRYDTRGRDAFTDPDFARELRRHYAACVSYADAQVGKVMDRLRQTGKDKNTIVVLWGDHGWNLGDHGMWGKHNLFEEALRSPLIISYPGLDQPGASSNAIVETVDMYRTLCDLTRLPEPAFTDGISLAGNITHPHGKGRPAVAYWNRDLTLRTDRYRLVAHGSGEYELYDHRNDPYEMHNVAGARPAKVRKLQRILTERLAKRSVD